MQALQYHRYFEIRGRPLEGLALGSRDLKFGHYPAVAVRGAKEHLIDLARTLEEAIVIKGAIGRACA
jgi:hypothetical protein